MMPLTLSLPLVLADVDGDAAVVAGMASAIPAASAPVTFDFMVSPGIAGTAHDRGAAHPSRPRKTLASILVCRGADHWPAPASRVALCSSGGVSQLRPGVRHACLPHAEGPSLFEKGRNPANVGALAAVQIVYSSRREHRYRDPLTSENSTACP